MQSPIHTGGGRVDIFVDPNRFEVNPRQEKG